MLNIKQLEISDIEVIVARFAENNWHKPHSTFETYLSEQQKGERLSWVASYKSQFAGYVTLKWQSQYVPFQWQNIPEIMDLNVLPTFRNKGIGTNLLRTAQEVAFEKHSIVGLGVGLYADYGSAQKLYIKNGYIPNGFGITYDYQQLEPGSSVKVDDDLVLWFTKAR